MPPTPLRFPEFKISHFGLFVFDLDAMVRFFTELFGFAITDRGIVRGSSRIVFLSRDTREHHQLVLVEGRDVPRESKLLNQISLRLGSVDDLREAHRLLVAHGSVSDIDPCNHGNSFSVYFKDPEGNRFELYTDSPFYVRQAVVDGLDLSLTDDELIADTRARHEADPTFRPVEEWRADFARKLGNTPDANDEGEERS